MYTLKENSQGLLIPYLNNNALINEENPFEEASQFFKQYEDLLKSKRNIILFGLGLGYHLSYLTDFYKNVLFKKEFFFVIGINECTSPDFFILSKKRNYNPLKIFYFKSSDDFFSDKEVMGPLIHDLFYNENNKLEIIYFTPLTQSLQYNPSLLKEKNDSFSQSQFYKKNQKEEKFHCFLEAIIK